MRRYLLLLLSICTLSIVAVVVLQPNPAIRTEAKLSRLPPQDALKLLEEGDLYGPDDLNIALIHARLSLEAGKLETARKLYREIADVLPEDAKIRDELSKIAQLAGDRADALAELEKAYRLEPTKERRERLAVLERLERNATAEIDVLVSVSPERLSNWEADRLSSLIMQAGDADEIENLYRQTANSGGPFAATAKDRLVVLLIDAGRSQEALEAALGWYVDSKLDAKLLAQLLPVFINRGAFEQALWFADRSMELSPETGYLLVREFARSGHRIAAGRFEDEILARGVALSNDEWRSLIDLAALTGDLHGLQTALAGENSASAPTDLLGEALLQFLRYRGSRALVPYRALFSDDLVAQTPLVASAFAVEHGMLADCVAYLADASGRDMTAWDRAIWLSIAQRLRGSGYLRQLAMDDALSPDLREALQVEIDLANR